MAINWKQLGQSAIETGLNAVTGGLASGVMGLVGNLFGGNSQKKMMQQAWEYEKEGMGLQYQYGQQAADAQQKRNLEMWNATNYEAQRKHLEAAGLNVGLMYGQGGAGGATAQGGQPAQPSGMAMNPVQAALQMKAMGLNLQSIQAQNDLARSQTTKNYADAAKTSGVDTKEAETRIILNQWDAKIKSLQEQIAANNYSRGQIETQVAAEELRKAIVEADLAEQTKQILAEQAIQQLINMKIQGALNISQINLNEKQQELIGQKIKNYFYEITTQRMTAEAAQKAADATANRVANDYEIAGKKLDQEQTKMIGDWIAAGIGDIISLVKEFIPAKRIGEVINTVKETFSETKGHTYERTTQTRQ